MKRAPLIALLLILAWPLSAWATSLVCDPQTGVASYIITGLPVPLDLNNNVPIQAQADGSLKLDVSKCPVGGPYAITVSACSATTVWAAGSCSASSPFSFSRPTPLSTPAAPANTKLVSP